MIESYHHGAVYIFENTDAQRVKIGITAIGVNDVVDRLIAVNDMWLQRKVTCQVCGGRLLNIMGLVPKHPKIYGHCPGSNALPLEKDVALAEAYLNKFSSRRKNTLEKRIDRFRNYHQPIGRWQFRAAFYTEDVEKVEFLSHKILAEREDKQAPFGEVFCCSASEAAEAVETALSHLELLHSARKETELRGSPRVGIPLPPSFLGGLASKNVA